MKIKLFISIFLFLLISTSVFSQFFHIGFRPSVGFFDLVTDPDPEWNGNKENIYHFANNLNESILFAEFSYSEKTKLYPYPDIFFRYDFKKPFFIQVDFWAQWFTSNLKLRNSVNMDEYANSFFDWQTPTGYYSMELLWIFGGHTISGGFYLFNKKSLRPVFFAGISTYYLNYFDQIWNEASDYRTTRTQILLAGLDTFNKISFFGYLGAGLKYKTFTLDFNFNYSKFIDINYFEGGHFNERTNQYSFYNYCELFVYSVSLQINLLSKFHEPKQKTNE
ncbi:MAG: hypothetical protein JXL97_11365 [Bacteroidales bacterium]|nr:hypothetical protein [Bacteroidales bacterium]